MGCGGNVGLDQEWAGTATRTQPLLYERNGIWPSSSLSVCWENFTDSTAEQREWTRRAVHDAYELVSAVEFTGWGVCGTAGADVVLRVDNSEWPRALVGSREASATPSVFFNFFTDSTKDLDGDSVPDFQNCYGTAPYTGLTGRRWNTRQEHCIEVIAVHEFAHVLGIDHEQNRNDTPTWCTDPSDDSGDTKLGYWDLTSISNYCDPAWSNDGRLSPLDADGIRLLYGKGENTLVWLGLGNVRNYGGAPTDQTNFAIWGTDVMNGFQPVSGDFDGDGKDDVFWYNRTGTDVTWWSNGDGSFKTRSRQISSGFAPFTGDFDGDGRSDVFLYGPAGVDDIWWGSSDRAFDSSQIDAYDAGFKPVVGDFDGDGRDDIFWYNPDGTDYLWWSNGDRSFLRERRSLSSGFVPFAGDFDGDGITDLFLYSPLGSTSLIWQGSANRTFTASRIAVSGRYSTAVGDFDGDGIDDILWSGATDSLWLMRRPIGTHVTTSIDSDGNGTPVSGDFNGDGFGDIIWYQAN